MSDDKEFMDMTIMSHVNETRKWLNEYSNLIGRQMRPFSVMGHDASVKPTDWSVKYPEQSQKLLKCLGDTVDCEVCHGNSTDMTICEECGLVMHVNCYTKHRPNHH